MKVQKKSSQRVNPEPGTHIALLTQIIDWGTVTDQYGDKRKIEFVFELPEDLHVFDEEQGEVPLIVTRKFGATLGRGSEMKKCIEGLLGKSIDEDIDEEGNYELEPLLRTVCQISTNLKKEGQYTNVEIMSYMPLPKGDKRKFYPHGPSFIFDLDNFDQATYNEIIDWKREKIAESPEFKALEGVEAPVEQRQQPQQAASAAKAAPAKTSAKAPVKAAPAKTPAKNLFNTKGKK